jgi:hypothetical protein
VSPGVDIIGAARDLGARVGFVIPLEGKKPILKDWPASAMRTPNGEPEWARATGVGLLTGERAGYFVLDVDVDKGGMESLATLEQKHGALPATWTTITGGGGRHYYFRWPGFPVSNSAGKLGQGLDVKGDRGQVVAPPSKHPSGTVYRWADGCAPWQRDLASAPAALLDLLRPSTRQPVPHRPQALLVQATGHSRGYGAGTLRSATAKVRAAPEGQRNETLNDEAFSLGQLVAGGVIARGEAEAALEAAALDNGLSEAETRATIRSGLNAGEKEPRGVPNGGGGPHGALDVEPPPPTDTPGREGLVEPARFREEPGCDDDDPAPVDAGRPADSNSKQGLVPLRDLIFRPTPDDIRTAPPQRKYLLTAVDDGAGVFPAGKVGALAAPGGGGKSWVLMQLAVAVATGGTWLGDGKGWKAARGRVLYVLGEEDVEEAMRRLHYAMRAAGAVSDEDVELVRRNLDLIPACGLPVALTTSLDTDLGLLPETQRCHELREMVRAAAAEGRPYSLVILDPLSRFAGTDVETDNAAATRFVQVLESLTSEECGRPSVLISAHERKKQRDDDPDSADPIRGSSALKDAFRLVMRLDQRKRKDGAPDLQTLRVVKTNLTRSGLKLTLCRPRDWHGALRVATEDEIEAYDQRSAKPESDGGAALPDKILAELAKGPASGNELSKELHVHKTAIGIACAQLKDQGRIGRRGQKWTLSTPNAGAAAP